MTRNFSILLISLCLGCVDSAEERSLHNSTTDDASELKFNEARWKMKKDDEYVYRSRMLNDLVNSRRLKAMDRAGVYTLLGKPNRVDNNHLFYRVDRERIHFFTLYEKTLVIKLNDNDSVLWVKIHG